MVWILGGWIAARRRSSTEDADALRGDYRTQTRGMGLRMTEWLRDRMRPSWLRVREDDHDDTGA